MCSLKTYNSPRGKTVYGAERTYVKGILGPSSMGTRATLCDDGAKCYPVQPRVMVQPQVLAVSAAAHAPFPPKALPLSQPASTLENMSLQQCSKVWVHVGLSFRSATVWP